MRFFLKKSFGRKDFGKKRVVEKFLWLPKELNREIRWLEKAYVLQEIRFSHLESNEMVYQWEDIQWAKKRGER